MCLHGTWPPCMAVATLFTLSQTKRAHEVIRIRTSQSLKTVAYIIHRANFCVRIFSHFSYLMHSHSLLERKSVLPAAGAHI